MNSHIHPTMAAALGACMPQPGEVAAIQRAAYVKALQTHDWHFEFSDDPSVYARGRDAFAALKMLQRELDADFALWNEHAPESFRMAAKVAA